MNMERLLLEFVVRAALIAAATGAALWMLRIGSAAARHAAWSGVMLAMLVLPALMAWGPKAWLPILPPVPPAPQIQAAGLAAAAPAEIAPLEQVSVEVAAPRAAVWNWSVVFAGIYLLGAGALLLRLGLGTILANRLTSAACVAPITVGLLHPRILLPEGWTEWPQALRDAVLTHEREHVRRRDPLVHWLALFNRAVFWFHPLAWWLERRLSALAEEVCDAAVLAHGCDAAEYSGFLLDLARSVERAGKRVHVVAAMAMPGGALTQRIGTIAAGVRAARISRSRLTFAALACAIPAVLFAAGTLEHMPQLLPLRPLPARIVPQPPVFLAQAQAPTRQAPAAAPEAPPAKLEFEVASVRPTGPRPANSGPSPAGGFMNGGPGTSDPVQISYLGVPLSRLLTTAFGITPDQLTAPDWVMTNGNAATMPRFDVVAKVRLGATKEQAGEMLENLLIERFHLAFHTEKKEFESDVLSVAKGGSKLKPAAPADGPEPPRPAPGSPMQQPAVDKDGFPVLPAGYRNMVGGGDASRRTRMTARMTTTAELLRMLQGPLGVRNLVDQTGLTDKYDFKLEYSNAGLRGGPANRAGRNGPPPAAQGDASDPVPDLFEALEKQLGLKLEQTKTALDVVVIDHIDKVPAEN
jgi:uncharacterized protein (TIGR03435 family)